MVQNQAKRNRIERLTTSVLLVGIVFVIMIWKGVRPFGEYAISFQGDYISQYLPSYYYLWDVIHGQAVWDFSWELGMGSNMAGGVSHFYLLNPYMIVLFFVKRDAIPYAMAVVFGLVLWTMAIGMLLFLQYGLDKRGSFVDSFLRVICSIAYACSLHTIMYMGMGWPITGMYVPFLMLFLRIILRGSKRLIAIAGYVLVLAYIMVLNIPQAYAVCLYLVFFVAVYSFCTCLDYNSIRIFVISSILALGISMFRFLPSLYCTMDSYRYTLFAGQGGFLNQYHHKIAAEGLEGFRKIQMLQFVLPLCIIIAMLFLVEAHKQPQKREKNIWMSIFLGIICLPLVVEVTNIMWNNGPYICFPVRHGYLIYFTVLALFYYVVARIEKERAVMTICCLATVFLTGYTVFYVQKYIDVTGVSNYSVKENESRKVLERVKLEWMDSAEGMPSLQYRESMLGNYYPLNTREQIETNQLLGYNQEYVRLSDQGASVDADALMNIRWTIDQNGNYKENECGYTWPLFVANPSDLDMDDLVLLNSNQVRVTNGIGVDGAMISLSVAAELPCYAVLPAYSANGWKYYNNENRVDSIDNKYHLMMIPIQRGDNCICADWHTPGAKMGCLVSIISLLAFVFFVINEEKRQHGLLSPGFYLILTRGAAMFFFLYIYLVPILYRVMRWAKNML